MNGNVKVYVKGGLSREQQCSRAIRISPVEPEQPDRAVKCAEKMLTATRLNAEFLNLHLNKFSPWLKPAPIVDDVLYLAFNVEVASEAPFDADDLRAWLNRHNVETRSRYTFWPDPEVSSTGFTAVRLKGRLDDKVMSGNSFCLPCHVGLTITDLLRMVDLIEAFFTRSWLGRRAGKRGA